jgi:putative N6-adenine-specific DNA methylase
MIAKTFTGLEPVLAAELKELGAENIEILSRAVSFSGDKALMYKSNLWCRTALHILHPIASFPVMDDQQLYDKISDIPWWEYFGLQQTFSIDAVLNQSNISHSQYAMQKTKDAIVDQFRKKYDQRPNVSKDNPDVYISIHISRNFCTVSLDSSGESLHKRGYRNRGGLAPVNEALAAGLILLSGWNKNTCFLDPMCGSGTIPIEAALIALNIPPGAFRKNFGFEKWKDFDPVLWTAVKKESELLRTPITHSIIGSDISGLMIRLASQNIKSAGLEQVIKLENKDFESFTPQCENGTMITNPPYGGRIDVEDITSLYKRFGDTLKRSFAGFTAWVISADKNAMKSIGLKPSKKYTLYNGPLECIFAKFELYKGSKKVNNQSHDQD